MPSPAAGFSWMFTAALDAWLATVCAVAGALFGVFVLAPLWARRRALHKP